MATEETCERPAGNKNVPRKKRKNSKRARATTAEAGAAATAAAVENEGKTNGLPLPPIPTMTKEAPDDGRSPATVTAVGGTRTGDVTMRP